VSQREEVLVQSGRDREEPHLALNQELSARGIKSGGNSPIAFSAIGYINPTCLDNPQVMEM